MKINKQVIKDLKPCTDRYQNYLKRYPNFKGDLEDFFNLKELTHEDKLWVSLRLMDRVSVEAFALDCAVNASLYSAATAATAANAANYATAANAANYAAYAVYAADAAATYAAAAYASAASAAYYAANAANYAAAAAYAAGAADAAYAADAAARAAEKQRQLEAILWLVDKFEEGEQ